MPQLLPCQHHSQPVRSLIARALFEDIKYISRKKTARAVAARFDPHTFHPRSDEGKENGKEMDSGCWRKVELGKRLPSVPRLQRVTAIYPKADRAARLRLWPAIDIEPGQAANFQDLLLEMPGPFRKLLFDVQVLNRDRFVPKVHLRQEKLAKLAQLGTPDSLAALLIIRRETRCRLNINDRPLLPALIYRTLIGLLHFTPFYEIGEDLYEYILRNYLIKWEDFSCEFPPYEKISLQLQAGRGALVVMHRIGLMDNTFRRQHNFLYWLQNTLREKMYKEVIRLADQEQSLLYPEDPLYQVLRINRLSATRVNRPIPIPYQNRNDNSFRIGNALDDPRWGTLQIHSNRSSPARWSAQIGIGVHPTSD